jgi:hypothetical protein
VRYKARSITHGSSHVRRWRRRVVDWAGKGAEALKAIIGFVEERSVGEYCCVVVDASQIRTVCDVRVLKE